MLPVLSEDLSAAASDFHPLETCDSPEDPVLEVPAATPFFPAPGGCSEDVVPIKSLGVRLAPKSFEMKRNEIWLLAS